MKYRLIYRDNDYFGNYQNVKYAQKTREQARSYFRAVTKSTVQNSNKQKFIRYIQSEIYVFLNAAWHI